MRLMRCCEAKRSFSPFGFESADAPRLLFEVDLRRYTHHTPSTLAIISLWNMYFIFICITHYACAFPSGIYPFYSLFTNKHGCTYFDYYTQQVYTTLIA